MYSRVLSLAQAAVICTIGSQAFFVATILERFDWLGTHQQRDINKDTYQ